VRTDGGVKRVAGAELVLYREGSSEFYVPDPDRYCEGGLPTRDAPIAFAPNAAVNRSILVLFHRVNRIERFGDVFCGVGARAVRLHLEAGVRESVLSDVNPLACRVARMNVTRHGLRARVHCLDAAIALSSFDFDAVDLDVHGSPVPFAQAAFRGVGDGYVHLTATDLESLYTPAARRKYLLDGPLRDRDPELEARVIVGALVRLAASVDVGAFPRYCLVEPGLRVRVCLECRRGKSHANRALEHLRRERGVGPVWSGPLTDERTLSRMRRELDRVDWRSEHVREVRRALGSNVLIA